MTRLKRLALTLAAGLVLLAATSRPACAQIPVVDVAHIGRTTAIYLKQLYEIAQRAQQIANQQRQLEYQRQALEKLEQIPLRFEPGFEEILEENLELLTAPHPDSLVQALFYALEDPPREFDVTFPGWQAYRPGDYRFGTQMGIVEVEDPRAFIAYQDRRVLHTLRQALLATRFDQTEIGRTLAHLRRIKELAPENVGHQQMLELQLALAAHAAEQTVLSRRDAMFRSDLLLSYFARDTNRELQVSRTEKELFERARSAIEERHGRPVPVHTGEGGRTGLPEWYQGIGR